MNATKIYKSYESFLNRKDKKANGVSQEFANANPEYVAQNASNISCWNCNDCNDCNDCNHCISCSDCNYCNYCNDCNDCNYCISCSSCNHCSDCNYCNYCNRCNGCISCSSCSSCSDCNHCNYCNDCNYCNYCNYCNHCISCNHCNDCNHCSGFKTNPQRIVSPVLGSRKSQTIYYWTEDHNQIVCGCFEGSLDDFKNKVEKVYGVDKGHGADYSKWVRSVEAYIASL